MSDRPRLVIDLDRCWGCRTCEVACSLEKALGPGSSYISIVEVNSEKAPLPGSPQGRSFIPVLCQQCDDPECVSVCPSGALVKDANRLITLEAELCIGCGACEPACPYGAILLSPLTGKAGKCDLCADRLDSGRLPACVQHCPGRALTIGAGPDRQDGGKKRVSFGNAAYLSRERPASLK